MYEQIKGYWTVGMWEIWKQLGFECFTGWVVWRRWSTLDFFEYRQKGGIYKLGEKEWVDWRSGTWCWWMRVESQGIDLLSMFGGEGLFKAMDKSV